jgi:hypothetical protein
LRATTRFIICWRLGDEINDDFPWQVMNTLNPQLIGSKTFLWCFVDAES